MKKSALKLAIFEATKSEHPKGILPFSCKRILNRFFQLVYLKNSSKIIIYLFLTLIGYACRQNNCYAQTSFSGCYISGALIDPASTVGCGNSGINNYCNLASLFVPAFSPTACGTFTTSGGVAHTKTTVYTLPAGCTATVQAEFRKRNYLGIGATGTGCSNCGMDALPDALSITQSGGIVAAQGSTLDVNVGTCGTYTSLGIYSTSTASISGGCTNADGSVHMIVTGGTFTVGGASNRADEIITFTINLSGTCGAACSGVLPIELTDFYGFQEGNEIKLIWKTASEMNLKHYRIEKSTDGKNWSLLKIHPPNNEAGGFNEIYSVNDLFPQLGLNYYRLNNIDKDGNTGQPHIIGVNFAFSREMFKYEQNEENIVLHLTNNSGITEEINLIDVSGKIIYRQMLTIGYNKITLSKNIIVNGIYCLYSTYGYIPLKEKLIVH